MRKLERSALVDKPSGRLFRLYPEPDLRLAIDGDEMLGIQQAALERKRKGIGLFDLDEVIKSVSSTQPPTKVQV